MKSRLLEITLLRNFHVRTFTERKIKAILTVAKKKWTDYFFDEQSVMPKKSELEEIIEASFKYPVIGVDAPHGKMDEENN